MKNIIRYIISICYLFTTIYANDAEYQTSANGLVPLKSENIRLDKEVLNVTRLDNYTFSVDVTYYLFNEDKEKNTTIGFEAPQPYDDIERNNFFYKSYSIKKKQKAELEAIKSRYFKDSGEYTGIKNFEVTVNGKLEPYKIVNVTRVNGGKGSTPFVGYLYYFKTHLKHGLNKIHQVYTANTSGSVYNIYEFEYILATAKEWKGGKIGDFRLNLDLGQFTDVDIENTFFNNTDNWKYKGKAVNEKYNFFFENDKQTRFFVQDGKLSFHKQNFVPTSGLILHSKIDYDENLTGVNLYRINKNFYQIAYLKDTKLLKIIKNLPFARRGYIFKTDYIASFYKKTPWYKEDKNYKADYNSLTRDEKEWLKDIEEFKIKIIRNFPFAKRGFYFSKTKYSLLQEYFEQYKWYKENRDYKAKLSDLSEEEKKSRAKMLKLKSISDKEFVEFVNKHK